MKRLLTLLLLTCFIVYAEDTNIIYVKKGEQLSVGEFTTNGDTTRFNGTRKQYFTDGLRLLYPVHNEGKVYGLVSSVGEIPKVSDWFDFEADRSDDAEAYDKTFKKWQKLYKAQLKKRAELYEDSELEYLLNLKFFKEPLKSSHKTWKKEPILEFIYRLSGFQDIQNAIPLEKNFIVADHQFTETPPKGLELPKVDVPKVEADVKDHKLATLVPRDCYYTEFQNFEEFYTALQYASFKFHNWSPGTYPKKFHEAVIQTMIRLIDSTISG